MFRELWETVSPVPDQARQLSDMLFTGRSANTLSH